MMGKCSVCGAYKDLRPYGKNGAWVCFACGMKDKEEASRQFQARLDGKPLVVVSRDIVALSLLCPDELLIADDFTEAAHE